MTDEAIDAARRDPGSIPHTPDPVAPIFFVSHATAYGNSRDVPAAEPNEPFSVFFHDLSQDVGQLMARRVGADPGFLDRGMHAGVNWESEILGAVASCQVFVALVSDPFAKSKWCGWEFDAFTRRATWRRSDGGLLAAPRCVLPVIWTPNPDADNPKIVMAQQWFVPTRTSKVQLEPLYRQEGIYGLYISEDRTVYRATVWRLAQEIKRLIGLYWVEPSEPCDSRSLINVFDEEEA